MTAEKLREEILFREIWLFDLAKINTMDSCRMRGVLRMEIESMYRLLNQQARLTAVPRASEAIVDL